MQSSLSSLIRRRLDATGSCLVLWSDPSALFATFVAPRESELNLKSVSRDNVLGIRVELGMNTADQQARLYSSDATGLEPLEEIVQCYSRPCTITVEDLLIDTGVQSDAATVALSRRYPALLIEMWDRIGKSFWESGDIDLGVALATFQQERGDEISLALAVLQATTKPPRLDLEAEETNLRKLGELFVAALLERRFGLIEGASVEDFVSAIVVHDLASTATGERLVGHLASQRDRVRFDRCLNAIARDREMRSSLHARFERVLDDLGVKLDELDLADLFALRIVPGIEELLADRLDARIDEAGEPQAFDELRRFGEIRRRQLVPYAGALAFDDAASAGRTTLAEAADVEDFFARYASDWAQIDRLYRQIEGRVAGVLQRAVETRYRLWLQDLTVAFTNRLARRQTWKFKRSQHALGASFAQAKSKNAVVISDALRYEMAEDLFDRITKVSKELDWAIASVPTKTEIGMSALLPTDEPLRLDVVDKKTVVRVGKRVTTDKPARDDAWKSAGYEVFSDVDVRSADTAKLDRIVVFHGSIDALGEKLQARAFEHYEAIITELARLVAELAKRGFRVTVTSDHGFLTLPPSRVGAVGSGAAPDDVLKRRYRIGSGGSLPEPAISRSGSDLAMEGDVTVSFPPAASVFTARGATVFVHGGLSLQEMTIPVLLVESKASAKGAGGLAASFPRRLRGRGIAVNVAREEGSAGPVRLRLLARAAGREVSVTSELGRDARTIRLSLTLPEDIPDGTVELTVMVDPGRVIDRRSVEYESHE
jgi:hypothetical protein